jgi:hypothetical protein
LNQKSSTGTVPGPESTQQQRLRRAAGVLGWCAAIIATLAFLTERACTLFPESTFELAPESRLPKWFAVPPELIRSQVVVKLDYYILPWSSRARFRLVGPHDRVLGEVTGVTRGEPGTLKVPQPGFAAGYPAYEVVSIGGVTEIIEHRKMEPIFYVSDDPAVRAELMVR